MLSSDVSVRSEPSSVAEVDEVAKVTTGAVSFSIIEIVVEGLPEDPPPLTADTAMMAVSVSS